MSRSAAEVAVLRTVAFHEAWEYLPTTSEVLATLDTSPTTVTHDDAVKALAQLIETKKLLVQADRVGIPATFAERFAELRRRDHLQARKRRRAYRVASYLSYLPGVRFVALANTTALGNARDGGDLDFFVVVKAGSIWRTRLLSAGLFKLAGLLPRGDEVPDAVCLSYFITDDALDISSQALPGGDPYFRHWFLQLVPLVDDGVGEWLWKMNATLRARHPFARRWSIPPDFKVHIPRFRLWTPRLCESLSKKFQLRWFPDAIKHRMNQDTTVIVTDKALKFHVDDGRGTYRQRHAEICRTFGVEV